MTLSQKLKQETKSLHAATEKAMGAKQLMSPGYLLDDYRQLLLTLYYAHQALEPLCLTNGSSLPTWQESPPAYRPLLPFLEQDLKVLGELYCPFRSQVSVPEISMAASPGVRYVLEGASQGAQFILPALQRSNWEVKPLGYYTASALSGQERWGAYKRWLDTQVPENYAIEIIDAAVKSFEYLLALAQAGQAMDSLQNHP